MKPGAEDDGRRVSKGTGALALLRSRPGSSDEGGNGGILQGDCDVTVMGWVPGCRRRESRRRCPDVWSAPVGGSSGDAQFCFDTYNGSCP